MLSSIERGETDLHVSTDAAERGDRRQPVRYASGVNLKVRRAAAVARSSRRVRNSIRPFMILKSNRWMRPQSQHCSRKFLMRGRVHSPYEMTW
jgi:hypothetical protein